MALEEKKMDIQDDPAATQLAPMPASKIKTELALSTAGVVLPTTMAEVSSLAQYMCKARGAISPALRDNPGECMAVIMDGIAWQMNPFALARMRYLVNDVGAYMSQVIGAVVQRWAPIKEKVIAPIYAGDGQALQCSFKLHHRETDEVIEYESPKLGEIKPQNSPLWKTEPRQQLYYYSMRAMARRHFPGLLLGVYDVEEAASMRDITPPTEKRNLLEDPEDAPASVSGEVIDPPKSASQFTRDTEISAEVDTKIDNLPPHDPETGEIEEEIERAYRESVVSDQLERVTPEQRRQLEGRFPAEQTETTLTAGPETVSPERIFKNLVDGVRECRTVKDYEAWRGDNMTPATRKAIGETWWKQLGTITAEVEDKVGFL